MDFRELALYNYLFEKSRACKNPGDKLDWSFNTISSYNNKNKSILPTFPRKHHLLRDKFCINAVLSGYITTLKIKQKLDVSSEGPSWTFKEINKEVNT
jgi:hypothetical protein